MEKISASLVLWTTLIVSAVIVLKFCFRGKQRLASLFYMSAPGLLGLAVIDLTSGFTGLSVPINFYNLTVSLFLGLPGLLGLVTSGFFR